VLYPPVKIIPLEKRTAFDPLGRPVEGEITVEVAEKLDCEAGGIKLLNGVQGHSSGFGVRHIESYAGRVAQITTMGHITVHAYVRLVISEFGWAGCQDDGRICLVYEDKHGFHHVICQWDIDLSIWSVTTAIPKRHMRNINVRWKK
jgi:hypothetical protein